MDRKRQKMAQENVIAELEQVKAEQACDKINFETEKCGLESKIDKYKEQCTELQSEYEKHQSENEKLQNYLEDLESILNDEEKSSINLFNTDLKSQITKDNESNYDSLGINSLPDEMIVEVFGYLTQNQLGQVARVCRRWNELAKSSLLWRKVNVKLFCSSDRERNTVVKSFIDGLPSCVNFIRLDFSFINVDFEELCGKLQQNCPHLEELILMRLKMSNLLPKDINICTQFLQDVKKLVFHVCFFPECSLLNINTAELNDNSKIEVLDLYNCNFYHSSKIQFSKFLYLKELRLNRTEVDDTWFVNDSSFINQLQVLDLGCTEITPSTLLAIQRHGHNLKELYLCSFYQEYDLKFNESGFPRLRTICLSDTSVKCADIILLIQSCPSLENVYVDECMAKYFAKHPFAVANSCKAEIVKAIPLIHKHNVDYSHN